MTDALQHLFNRLRAGGYPAAQLGGIYANKPGYHNKRDQLPGSDYSCQQPDDLAGSGQDAAVLDITLHDPTDMARITQRLIDLTNASDPRIQVLREFFGTVDGAQTVTGRDVRTHRWITSDDSHLWHCHISAYRRWAGDTAAMDAVADAILGTEAEDMTPDQANQLAAIHHYLFDPVTPKGQTGAGCITNTYLALFEGGPSMPDAGRSVGQSLHNLTAALLLGGPSMPDDGKPIAESVAEISAAVGGQPQRRDDGDARGEHEARH